MKGCRGVGGGGCESVTVNVFGECERGVVRKGVKVCASFSRQDRTCVHEGDVYSCPHCSLWNPCEMQNPHRTCWNSRLVWPSCMSLLRALRLSAWTAPPQGSLYPTACVSHLSGPYPDPQGWESGRWVSISYSPPAASSGPDSSRHQYVDAE